ncbi:MAG TPA: hypothetical protein PLC04_07675, partial [Candidatus Kapabacteria bacterium]|nr:hypothetical protein [Candidatus Kapabacteria bacterium]
MKKRNLFLIVPLMIILSINSLIYAHKEWVHQYIVKESYKFLEQELGDIPELKYYDLLGNCVQSGLIYTDRINISSLPAGFYTVRFYKD